MHHKKTIFILMLLFPAMSFIPGPSHPARRGLEKWMIVKGSSLRVDGSTNINRFSCEIADYCEPDTLIFNDRSSVSAGQQVSLTGTISVAVSEFDCHNAMMTAEMRKTLKYASFPRLNIHFLSLSRLPDPRSLSDSLKGQVDIVLAGVSRHMEINYRASSFVPKTIRLRGFRQMKFSDFGLVPPRKLGGMIRTSDRVDIEFTLCLQAIE